MKVKLIYYTPIDIAYYSAKTCYSSVGAIDMFLNDKTSKEEKQNFIKKVISTGHLSTVEGINFTFSLEGVSRALLAQITRHRTGIQFSVQSQRYVQYDNPEYYEPDSILKNREADAVYNTFLNFATETYKKLIELDIKPEDARYVLPNATCTNITTTINLRELIHIMGLRRCSRAQKEIRVLCKSISDEVLIYEPWLKDYLVPQCEMLGYCPELKSCGRKKKLKEIINDKASE